MADPLTLFAELAAIPSPPGDEREVADRVIAELRAIGLQVDEDECGSQIGSTIGNLYARVEATSANGGTPLFFCAHLDTVPPQGPISPVVEDGFVRNAAGTILGADNKAAVVAMLEAVRRVVESGRPHSGIELVFTPKEEVGLIGAKAFDSRRLAARLGYVYDMAAPIGTVILAAPSARKVDFRFHGRAAHSGMYPEDGRSAIAAAARAIADFRLGRLDDETTANVGTIAGGTARNIVPEWCTFEAEVRSLDDRKVADVLEEMLEAATFAASLAECDLETEVASDYKGYRFGRDDAVVQLALRALERTGHDIRLETTGGAADANVFNERGLQCLNLANGMAEIHTPDEHIAVDDLEAMVEVTLAIIDAAHA
ncbi:MAG TPA: M20/M25/M40 family metallo-hydrolase [Gaiellaceae bacterium]|nr:M20/M25/M40 family metallo-hydrolase [Gaiellaceae bacterium]